MRFRKGDFIVDTAYGKPVFDIWLVVDIIDDYQMRVKCVMPYSEYEKTRIIPPKDKWEGFTCICSVASLEDYKIITKGKITFK